MNTVCQSHAWKVSRAAALAVLPLVLISCASQPVKVAGGTRYLRQEPRTHHSYQSSQARRVAARPAPARNRVAAAEQAPPAPQAPLYEWWGDGVPGKAEIKINLATQKAKFYKGGQLVGWSTVATGKPGYDTPTGTYTIMDKAVDRNSNTYGVIMDRYGNIIDYDARRGREKVPPGGSFEGAPMPYWMQFTSSGHGMHAGIIPNPGQPASHGCVRLPREMAATFYRNAPPGSTVQVFKDYSEREEQMVASMNASPH